MKPLLLLLVGLLLAGIGLWVLTVDEGEPDALSLEGPESPAVVEQPVLELPLDSLPGSEAERRRAREHVPWVEPVGAPNRRVVREGRGEGRRPEAAGPAPGTEPHDPSATTDPDESREDRPQVDYYGRPYEDGERQIAYYDNGQLLYLGSQTMGEDGSLVRDGHWEAWHENGTLHELGGYRNDVEHGAWKWWYENGQLQATGSFEEGKREGKWNYWYEDGTRMMDSEYHAGETCGWWTFYHENGHKRAEGLYVRGKFEGRWTVWFDHGQIDADGTGTYVAGKRIGD